MAREKEQGEVPMDDGHKLTAVSYPRVVVFRKGGGVYDLKFAGSTAKTASTTKAARARHALIRNPFRSSHPPTLLRPFGLCFIHPRPLADRY